MDILLFIIIILLASILQTSTGFGFSIIATPFLLLLFEPKEAIQINLLLSLVISLALIFKIKKDVDFGILKRFILGSVFGLPAGILIFLMVSVKELKLIVGIILLVLTVLLLLRYRIMKTGKRDLAVGGLSGLFTTSIGMPGPPLLIYFAGSNTTKHTLRATTLAFYLFIYFLSMLIQVFFAGTTKLVWTHSLAALPLVVLGLFVGQLIFKYISSKLFQIFIYIILLFTGVYLLWEGIF
ncbi:sulfite exporter TauE/SafE family protein [Saliterribacillus persicus]|uniref:Probable membrane transporter protein n=1 Tax=Saliterribacillus persicus TaxID=930114 RepID=A0A368Y9N7_9BACI|nr:sulfite exporter TauE/SafE family protein [Saliterribacillus persicus]RCW76922.1 putative membrane protein YfcA [Saliterribacillus persicus]